MDKVVYCILYIPWTCFQFWTGLARLRIRKRGNSWLALGWALVWFEHWVLRRYGVKTGFGEPEGKRVFTQTIESNQLSFCVTPFPEQE